MDSRRFVRAFVNSIVGDMHAEPHHLVAGVFPELREGRERVGIEFFDVDLRQGEFGRSLDAKS